MQKGEEKESYDCYSAIQSVEAKSNILDQEKSGKSFNFHCFILLVAYKASIIALSFSRGLKL